MKENYLFNHPDITLYQSDKLYKASLDSVLLSHFVRVKKNDKYVLDIGTGNGPIPLLLKKMYDLDITGVEIQKETYLLAKHNAEVNELDIKFINGDINKLYKTMENEKYDIITCNPPYFLYQNEELINDKTEYALSRHAITLTTEDIMVVSKKLLKNKGSIVLVQRPEYLINIIETMKKYNIEPKRIKFVYPKKGSNSNIVLIEGVKNGRPSLKVEDALYVYEKGEYSNELYEYLK